MSDSQAPSVNCVTQLLNRIEAGDGQAAAELFPLVYDELRRLAKRQLAGEKAGQTLQATALVHEAFVRMVGAGQQNAFSCRSHFFSAAAQAMRHILVDAARGKLAIKRGGKLEREAIDIDQVHCERPHEILAVHEALDALASIDPQSAEVVKLHYFGGFSLDEIADVLGVSRSTTNRWWRYARAWLRTEIELH